jgi:5-formyltetrahydrofolate cyclo-ligase
MAKAHNVGLYLPMGSEVDTAPLIKDVAALGRDIALPRVADRSALMAFCRWQSGVPLENGVFGFQQPGSDAPVVEPGLIVAPLIAFDAALNRLGQGAGHYDRYFSRNSSALRIGIAYLSQKCEPLDPDSWDVPLDGVLTEMGWFSGLNSRIGSI